MNRAHIDNADWDKVLKILDLVYQLEGSDWVDWHRPIRDVMKEAISKIDQAIDQGLLYEPNWFVADHTFRLIFENEPSSAVYREHPEPPNTLGKSNFYKSEDSPQESQQFDLDNFDQNYDEKWTDWDLIEPNEMSAEQFQDYIAWCEEEAERIQEEEDQRRSEKDELDYFSGYLDGQEAFSKVTNYLALSERKIYRIAIIWWTTHYPDKKEQKISEVWLDQFVKGFLDSYLSGDDEIAGEFIFQDGPSLDELRIYNHEINNFEYNFDLLINGYEAVASCWPKIPEDEERWNFIFQYEPIEPETISIDEHELPF